MTAIDPFPHRTSTTNLAAFCAMLRRDHRFTIGPGEAQGALWAIAAIGIADQGRVRAALKLVLSATREQAAALDPIFNAFFLPAARDVLQTNLHARHTHPPSAAAPPQAADRPVQPPPRPAVAHEERAGPFEWQAQRQIAVDDDPNAERAQRLMRAHYSTMAAASSAPEVPREGLDTMLAASGLLMRRLRLGRSRRWRPMPVGTRFDFRRTMRAILETGGEALQPRRNPRIVVVVDDSRSMAGHAARWAWVQPSHTSMSSAPPAMPKRSSPWRGPWRCSHLSSHRQ